MSITDKFVGIWNWNRLDSASPIVKGLSFMMFCNVNGKLTSLWPRKHGLYGENSRICEDRTIALTWLMSCESCRRLWFLLNFIGRIVEGVALGQITILTPELWQADLVNSQKNSDRALSRALTIFLAYIVKTVSSSHLHLSGICLANRWELVVFATGAGWGRGLKFSLLFSELKGVVTYLTNASDCALAF